MDVVEAQGDLLKIGIEFQRLDHRLYKLAGRLPRPENQDEMFECTIPLDLASGIYGAIEFLRETALRQVIEGLQDASKLTVGELERSFRELREREAMDSPGEANR